jgi:hypothetical protein
MSLDDDFLADVPPAPRPRGWRRFLPRFRRGTEPGSGRRLRRLIARVALAILVLLLLYYPVGMLWLHNVDANPEFGPTVVPEGGSEAVAVAAALITREVDTHQWVANDPFFLPGAALDNMPNYQLGIISALSRFAIEMTDQMGRTRGSSRADPDLDKAAGLLKYPGTVWIWDLSTSWAPTAPSDSQYRAAGRALMSYNERLAAGGAVYDRRSDNLLATLERMNADLGSASAVIEQHVHETGGALIDFKADDIFYNTKGRLYGYALLLRALGHDFADVLGERDMIAVWNEMIATFFDAAAVEPWVISNGSPDAMVVPNHLLAQGFYLLRARTQLREIDNILLK